MKRSDLLLKRLPKWLTGPRKKLQAATRGRTAEDEEAHAEDEPQVKLTSAFLIVLVLHVVAIGGILAFTKIKPREKTASGHAADAKSSGGDEASPDAKATANAADGMKIYSVK